MRHLALAAVAAAALRGAAAQSCSTLNGVFYTGGDVNFTYVAQGECCGVCAGTPECAGWSWLPDASGLTPGRCYTKQTIGSAENVAGAVSGVLAGAAGNRCPYGLLPCPANGVCTLFASQCAAPLPAGCVTGSTLCPLGDACSTSAGFKGCANLPTWWDNTKPVEERAAAIVSALTLDEVGAQLSNLGYGPANEYMGVPAVPRLGLPAYNWLNEGLHGVARSGYATSAPQISVVGSTFNRSVFLAVGQILGLEARAKHTLYRRLNDTENNYRGVTYYAPNINLARDPRWGRIQEVPSEDPLLLSAYGIGVVQGAQQLDPAGSGTPAIAACCKHLAMYSEEGGTPGSIPRGGFNALVGGRDMLETYLPHFQQCFMVGRGRSSMCSYNAVNGVPTCASGFLINATVRTRYGMGDDTWVMSDYSAVQDTWADHHYCASPAQCVADTMLAGVDQDGGGLDYKNVSYLVAQGLLPETVVRRAATRLFTARIQLGLLDPPEVAPFQPDARVVDSDPHRFASLDAARQGIVLLSNKGALPLSRAAVRGAAVIGPNADNSDVIEGNYQGQPAWTPITPRVGLVRAFGGNASAVAYAPGCADVPCASSSGFAAAIAAAQSSVADAVIVVVGLDQTQEREGMDRTNLTLPGNQGALIQALQPVAAARGVPFIVVLITGGPLDVSWALQHADAVVLLGYAAQSTGDALAQVLFGDYAPAGKLAVTWPVSEADLPPMPDMAMAPNASTGTQGRTYRYALPTPLLPFGHGLSYTTWGYESAALAPAAPHGALATGGRMEMGGARVAPAPASATAAAAVPPVVDPCAGVNVTVTLRNTGAMDSSEVVQVYANLTAPAAALPPGWVAPRWWLAEFDRVTVPAGGAAQLTFTLTPRALAVVNSSAAAGFGQDFRLADAVDQADAVSGRAFGLDQDYHAAALQAGAGAIGWDDLFVIPSGASFGLWVGSGQPGFGAPGTAASFVTSGPAGGFVNLASCALRAAAGQ